MVLLCKWWHADNDVDSDSDSDGDEDGTCTTRGLRLRMDELQMSLPLKSSVRYRRGVPGGCHRTLEPRRPGDSRGDTDRGATLAVYGLMALEDILRELSQLSSL